MTIRNRYLFLLDGMLLSAALVVGFALRLEGWDWGPQFRTTALAFGVISVPLKLAIFYRLGLYRHLWAYAGAVELERIIVAGFVAGLACFPIGAVLLPAAGLTPSRVPLSVLAWCWIIGIAAAAAPRWIIRMNRRDRPMPRRRREDSRKVLIAGAGAAGEMIVREMRRKPEIGFDPVGFVDDAPRKQGQRLADLPVLGPLAAIPDVVERHRVAQVIIAMPSVPGRKVREVMDAARATGVHVRTVPGLFELISGRKAVSALRDVEIQDLLRREPVKIDLAQVRGLARDRTVLVTGAGGSIGSELCRQLAELGPERLVLLGHGENSIFHIYNELYARFPEVDLVPAIGDIRDTDRMRDAFRRWRPFGVFHAAAHKHVPLMEHNVQEAITNNVLGTRNVAELCAEFGVSHLVLVSSDKAVRPTNVMGATKRVAEQVVQEVAARTGRRYVAVRFGNVLGSRGSVVPTFLKQIAAGGPVTVTHPEMTRYFMTIPESVQLVLQAAALGGGGEVFVLDMGQPVKIVDLATDLIRLCGFEPGSEVEIRFSGMRPGEKLYEELFFGCEHAAPTEHPKILSARNAAHADALGSAVDALIAAAQGGADDEELRRMLSRLVPDYAAAGRATAAV